MDHQTLTDTRSPNHAAKLIGATCAAAAAALALAACGAANAAVVVVDGSAGPWSTTANPTYSYGDGAQTAPTAVAVSPLAGYVIQWVSGITSTDNGFSYTTDANGYCCVLGVGFNAPGQYVVNTPSSPQLMELVGTFADASGDIVGTPFAIGDGPLTQFAPAGASYLLLGVNDDQYSDNIGSYNVSVTPVPEPETWALALLGLFGLGAMLRMSLRRPAAQTA